MHKLLTIILKDAKMYEEKLPLPKFALLMKYWVAINVSTATPKKMIVVQAIIPHILDNITK